MTDFTPTLFDMPHCVPAIGPGEPGAAWWVWSPELDALLHMEPELAAQYQQQGCYVILAEEDERGVRRYPSPRPLSSYPEPEPDAPPYSGQTIAWYWAAANFAPEAYNPQWERIADWLRTAWRGLRPEDVAEEMARRYGRWGNGYDLEAAAFEDRSAKRRSRSQNKSVAGGELS